MSDEAPDDALPRYLQLMWDRAPAGRRGPKPARTIWQIGEAAVAVADAHGLDAVSMKSVATALGMTSMSLYRYVDSKDDLLAVMLDVAYGPVTPAVVLAQDGWRARLTAWAQALATVIVAHPWIRQATPSEPPTTPNLLGWTDLGVATLDGLPLDGQEKLSALLVVDGYVRSHVYQSLALGVVGRDESESPPADVYGPRLALLVDPERMPSLARAALDAFGGDEDDDFFDTELAFGLDLVLGGIAALAAVPPAKRRRPALTADNRRSGSERR